MKVWYDACTGKQVRYGVAIIKRLRKKGYEAVLTTRKHPDTVALAQLLGEEFHIIGKYDPTSRATSLYQSLKRQLLFYKMFKDDPLDVAVSHRSVELCRVAFGLGIPIISTHDAPHAEAINRLTMSLIDVLVVSKAIPEKHLHRYGIREFVKFDGVDEVAWIKDFKPKTRFDYESPLIVVRQFETKAAYAEEKVDVNEEIARKLTSLGKVVFLPRYDNKARKGLIVPKGFIDSASLVAQADLVVSAGGTISREAALQGTPSIVISTIGRSFVNDYLSEKGFPLFTVRNKKEIRKVLDYARKYLDKKQNVKPLLAKLENPVDVIEKECGEIAR